MTVADSYEEILAAVDAGKYDLILCGLELQKVQAVAQELSKKVGAGIFQFELGEGNYRDFFPGFDFVRELTCSENQRLCFASNKYCYFEELGALKVDKTSRSVMETKGNVYFFCGDKFVKYFNQTQQIRASREIQFLEDLGGQRGLPKILAIHTETNGEDKFSYMARELIAGVLLKDVIESGDAIDRWDVIKQALEWLIFLEQRGYYFGDFSVTNLLYNDGKIYLIDYEDILREPIAITWPYSLSCFFFLFMNQVLAPSRKEFAFHREARLLTELKRYLTQRQYEQIAALKNDNNFYRRLYEILFQQKRKKEPFAQYNMADIEIMAIGKYLDDVGKNFKENDALFNNHAEKINEHAEILNAHRNVFANLYELIQNMAGQRESVAQLNAFAEEYQRRAFNVDNLLKLMAEKIMMQHRRLENLERIVSEKMND